MILKGLIDEDFTQYKKPSMFLIFPNCTFKCCKEAGRDVCQNSSLATANSIDVSVDSLCSRYINNDITKSIACGGLEPLDSPEDLLLFVDRLRVQYLCEDDIIIYSGYTEAEVLSMPIYEKLCNYPNIIIKFGRFVPDDVEHFDEVLGINLISSNQYAKKIS